MTSLTDATHDPALRSWVRAANVEGADFPIQNLPFGRFRRQGSAEPWRIGVAIGDQVLDLATAAPVWPSEQQPLFAPLAAGDLNAFMALGRAAWRKVRAALSAGLAAGSVLQNRLAGSLVPLAGVELTLPCRIGDYSDFYAGIHHARTIGALMRPDNPLLPNYRWVPIGYHGRASSIGVGGRVRRPAGQTRGSGDTSDAPAFGPTRRLDYELEVGAFVGTANALGEPVAIGDAEDALFGLVLLNDWSARDIQAWEYQPLGPFLAKSFATSISPWIVTMEALAPFRRPFVRAPQDPQPLPYLDSPLNREAGAFDMTLEVWLQTSAMAAAGLPAVRLSQSNLLDAYWTFAQMLAHHTSNGCNLQSGDLLGSGTIAGPRPEQGGSLMELSDAGKQPVTLPNGEQRTFLHDGDTVILRGHCSAGGAVRIGFGEVAGTVV